MKNQTTTIFSAKFRSLLGVFLGLFSPQIIAQKAVIIPIETQNNALVLATDKDNRSRKLLAILFIELFNIQSPKLSFKISSLSSICLKA